jgi:hypothetical protein
MGCTTGAASGIIKRQSVSGQRIDRSKKQKPEPISVLLLFSINEKDILYYPQKIQTFFVHNQYFWWFYL